MNLVPSDLPRVPGALSVSEPGFDIVLAVSGARQAALPTVHMLRQRAIRGKRRDDRSAVRALLVGKMTRPGHRPCRFIDLSDDAHMSPETMNSLFTRGFQAMLNSSHVDRDVPGRPASPDVETME